MLYFIIINFFTRRGQMTSLKFLKLNGGRKCFYLE